jgi:hypothetical protein
VARVTEHPHQSGEEAACHICFGRFETQESLDEHLMSEHLRNSLTDDPRQTVSASSD